MTEEKTEERKLTRQEENWMLMTTLQIPWRDCNLIEDRADRDFLLEKVKEVSKFMMEQQKMEAKYQEMAAKGGHQPPDGGGLQPPQSNIITPQDIMQGR